MGKGERPGNIKLSMKGRLIERLVIIILKIDYEEGEENDEEIDIIHLYR